MPSHVDPIQTTGSRHHNLPYPTVTHEVLDRYYRLTSFNALSTHASGTAATAFCPFYSWFMKNINYVRPFKRMRFSKAHIRIVPTGSNPTLRGSIRISWTKLFTHVGGSTLAIDMFRNSTVDNLHIPVSTADEINVVIPWVFHKSLFDLSSDFASSGVPTWFCVNVEQPLGNTADTIVAVSYDVFVRLEGVELYDSHLDYTVAPFPFLSVTGTPSYVPVPLGAFSGPHREAVEKSERSVIAGVASTVAKASSLAAPILPTGAGQLLSNVANMVSSVAQEFGLDKPTCMDFAKYCSLRIGDHLVHMDGLDPSLVLNVSPDASDDIDHARYGESVNPTLIHNQVSKFSILHFANVPSTVPALGTVFSFPVSPILKSAAGDHKTYANNLSYFSSLFSHWRGDIRYRLAIHNDSFFDAKFLIILSPHALTGTVTEAQLNAYRNTAVAAKGSTVFEFTIPWHNLSEWDLCAGSSDTPYVSMVMLQPARRSGVNCGFSFTLENASSEDPARFQLAEPTSYAPPITHGYLNDGMDASLGTIGQNAIVPVTDLRDLIKRYSLTPQVLYSAPDAAYVIAPRLFNYSSISLIARAFQAFRGSWRITFYLPKDFRIVGKLKNPYQSATGTFDTSSTLPGVLVGYQDYNPEKSLEFHFMSPHTYAFTRDLSVSKVYATFYFQAYDATDALVTTSAFDAYQAVGDDFTFGVRGVLPNLY